LEDASKLNALKELLLEYLDELDEINPAPENVFKTEQEKTDLETKLWYLFRKLEAADYHRSNVCNISERARQRIAAMPDLETKDRMSGQVEIRIEDRAILFETDAFFVAARSALDFLATVTSKYRRGKTFHRFKKLVEDLENCADPIGSLVEQAWTGWGRDLISYRDHLIHRGVISLTSASHIKAYVPKSQNAEMRGIIDRLGLREGLPIIFPVPKKPSSNARLTRKEIMADMDEELPRGLSRTEEGARISGDGRTFEMRAIRYELAPGYVEACELCQYYQDKLLEFSYTLFQSIRAKRFTYVS